MFHSLVLLGVGGQAIWSAEDRQKSASGTSRGKVLSWLGLSASSGGDSQDYFSHFNVGLAAALQGDHAAAAAEFQLALRLCNSSVELHAKLFEEQLALLAVRQSRNRTCFDTDWTSCSKSEKKTPAYCPRRPRHVATRQFLNCGKQRLLPSTQGLMQPWPRWQEALW